MKILTILGARPQFIKAGAVSRAIKEYNEQLTNHKSLITEIIVHTGQHYDANMSDIFFEEMKIPKPDYYLGIGGKSHGAMTGQMIEKIEEVTLKEKPDWIMVYGDTNSTLAGAIVASKLHIKLAHVEAGLRSFNMKMPEEVNRILTDRVSDILFCPTDTAVENLKKEGFPFITASGNKQRIVNVGDVMLDVALYYKQFAKPPNHLPIHSLTHSSFILCTIHRAENTDNPERLKNIFEALEKIAKDTQIVLPLHPRTKQKLEKLSLPLNSITIIDPIGYLEMIWLLDNCELVITDSGGLQKEAYFFKKPCITLRDETEWVELVEIGANVLVGADKDKIVKVVNDSDRYFEKFYSQLSLNTFTNIYGDGKAGKLICNYIQDRVSDE
ncbi:non-hydrolyzing UDP-N-acetylglucosamine 2-epimerase [Hippea jasoniae]|uniref:non-hydrolyzing UDP-N-acetylglucosamine 2-epimerase n=1 Tax=Hippea jasoniae TaxID=944479 RepID=UPI00054DD3C8|nr:UDP-N-acetylglucosamine 2-epimerase (non-hydrolyzing) [Hippea jasoniae]